MVMFMNISIQRFSLSCWTDSTFYWHVGVVHAAGLDVRSSGYGRGTATHEYIKLLLLSWCKVTRYLYGLCFLYDYNLIANMKK